MTLLSTSLVIPSLKMKRNCPWIWQMFLTRLKKKIEHFLNLKKMESSLYGTGQRLKISGTSSVASGGVGAAPPDLLSQANQVCGWICFL